MKNTTIYAASAYDTPAQAAAASLYDYWTSGGASTALDALKEVRTTGGIRALPPYCPKAVEATLNHVRAVWSLAAWDEDTQTDGHERAIHRLLFEAHEEEQP